MTPLFLIGLPGSGKSTVGRNLARRLGLSFLDTDQVVEERIGCSIREYFEHVGEDGFRDIEETVLDELTQTHAGVLATGGGAVLRTVNRSRLRTRGHVVYLRSSPAEVLRRVQNDRNRPLLQVEDPMARLRELFEQRDPLYRETAHFVVETGRPSVARLAGLIVSQLELGGWSAPN